MLRNSLFRMVFFASRAGEQHADNHLQRHFNGSILQRDANGLNEPPVRKGLGVIIQANKLRLAQIHAHFLHADPEEPSMGTMQKTISRMAAGIINR